MRLEIREETASMVLPDGRQVVRRVEVRTHPLTGDTVRILTPPHRPLRIPDLRTAYAHTLEGCPFCPEAVETRTPAFPPDLLGEGRVAVGEVRVFPNLLAYAGLSAVSVLTREHFVELRDFTEPMLLDAFEAARRVLGAVRERRPDLAVRLLHWNYMPPAGSSIVHPHHQLMATPTAPTRLRRLAEGATRIGAPPGTNPWHHLVSEERRAGARWLGEAGPWRLLVDPAPQGRYFEWVAVHASKADMADLEASDWGALVPGLLTLFGYLESQGLWSFNLAAMGLPDPSFRCQVRLVPRAFLPPASCSDIHFDVLEQEPMILRSPEDVASELRPLFGG
ncbi:hypothetical protein [Deferrisoma sp.]